MANESLLTVIIGAGASYDCVGATDPRYNNYRPPLVHQLFDNREQSFNPILNHYPRAERCSGAIRAALNRDRGSITIERLLREMRDGGSLDRWDFMQVGLYLRELLGVVEKKFIRPGGSSGFDALVRLIERSNYASVLFLTVNYDLFLESALSHYYPGVQFSDAASYLPVKEKWKIVKLHGSVNWGQRVLNLSEAMNAKNILAVLDELEGKLDIDPQVMILKDYEDERYNKGLCYPAIAVPVEGKAEFICPKSHVEFARQFLPQCRDFLIIGFSALDKHVLDELREGREVKKLMVVCDTGKVGETISRITERCRRFHTLGEKRYEDGFSNFVSSDELRTFLGVAS